MSHFSLCEGVGICANQPWAGQAGPGQGYVTCTVLIVLIQIPPGGSLSIDYSRADPGPGLAPRGE